MNENKETQQHPNVEIAVENFGPIVEANIDLRPLTVFVGPSNTGKTYFATLVYALHGACAGFSRLCLLSSIDRTTFLKMMSIQYRELLRDSASVKSDSPDVPRKLDSLEKSFKFSDIGEGVLAWWMEGTSRNVEGGSFFKAELQTELRNCFDLSSISALMRFTGEQRDMMRVSLKVGEDNHDLWDIKMTASESDVGLSKSVNEERFRDIVIFPEGWSISPDTHFSPESTFFHLNLEDAFRLGWIGGNRYYLPAARSGIMQSHRILASSIIERITQLGIERFPEVPTLSGIIADFMQKITLYTDVKTSNDEMKHLAETLESDVLAGQIYIEPSPSGYPDFRYRPQGMKEAMRLTQTSSMVSELAPLVLYLRGLVNPGDTLIIEEPEAHLHPGAQADMAVILARLVRAGVKVIITTHSDWLLQEVSNLTLEGLLEEEADEPASWLLPEEVGVWHFQKDQPVREIPFKSREGISPEDYEDVAEGLYNRSVNLQQKLEKKKGKSERESV